MMLSQELTGDDYRRLEFDSHMLKHQILGHGDSSEKLTFKMKILKFHTSAFMRQVHEAVAIEQNEKNGILNSKGGYNRCKLPRLSIKMGKIEAKDGEEKLSEMNEIEIEREINKMRKEKKIRKMRENDEILKNSKEPPRKKKRRWKVEIGKKRKSSDENEDPVDQNQNLAKKPKIESDAGVCDNPVENEGCTQQVEFIGSEINMCSEKNEKKSKMINFFENLRNKNTPKENNLENPKFKDIHISSDNFNFLFSSKPAGMEINKGGSREQSKNKANSKLSPAPIHTHQPRVRPSCRKRNQRPNFNYKPINHHFTQINMESESILANKEKIVGNLDSL